MIPRLRDRLAHLEAQLLPPPAARVFFIVIEDQSPLTSDEQLASFPAAAEAKDGLRLGNDAGALKAVGSCMGTDA